MAYLFTHEDKQERERLAAIEAGLDPFTTECLNKIGVAEGWKCLEVGAGGGSMVEWLCHRVRSTRKVALACPTGPSRVLMDCLRNNIGH